MTAKVYLMQSIKIAQMTWKDKFAIFCVKGERLIVKNKKKRIIGLIILVLIILTAGIFILGHNHINSQKNEKKSLETKSDINKLSVSKATVPQDKPTPKPQHINLL